MELESFKTRKKCLQINSLKGYLETQNSFGNPLFIVTPEEALEAKKGKSKKTL